MRIHGEYLTGEQPEVGDTVSHYVDGDTGTVTDIRNRDLSGFRTVLTVNFEGDGEMEVLVDEVRLDHRNPELSA